MDYLCSECSMQLTKFEVKLNELYPVGKLYCEFCQNKHEREIIKKDILLNENSELPESLLLKYKNLNNEIQNIQNKKIE